MELLYKKNQLETTIIYGETFASQIKGTSFESKHLFLITNQRYYDLFSEKLIQFFDDKQELDWYICKNDAHCNNMDELENLVTFLADFDQQHHFLFLGVGNEGAVQLTNFLHETSVLNSDCWLLPLSIQSLSKSLIAEVQIELKSHPVLQSVVLADKILYDHTLTTDHGEGKLVDFLVFIRCGLVCSHDFLRMLFKNYSDATRLNQQSFNGMLDELIRYYEKDGQTIDQFGQLFEHGFLETPNGHLLSGHMKRFLGMLLQLLWSQEVNQLSFHYKNFIIWLIHLGFPVDFPEQILVGDYVEGIVKCLDRGEKAALLKEVGEIDCIKQPTIEDLLAIVEKYKTILKEIRG
ncbi:hypothetical protein [Enterococcus caccae]|uniref:3-dehydroquinate synthase domain-containing protein n=1 Tax=Enterococcus caccae ATCC BAA-1240 TaxID=1158612 RepID=R3TT19_9ENTE|nr:hypothetical protein [Enterococcus caccae]EOL44318.1 hypothetical protein UC7_02362 [Enterococcus caccae ATCC BAA-1240]EOT68566.1 hypothetical protein I580_00949 [Enterococcus caccae ATCC BAA-1240]